MSEQSSLENAVLDRRIKLLEEEARVSKGFRGYVMKRFAEFPQGKMNLIKEPSAPETTPNEEQLQRTFLKSP